MRIFTIIILIIILSCNKLINAQTYTSVISDQEIYSFMNWMIKNDTKGFGESNFMRKQIMSEIVPWDTSDFIIIDTALLTHKQQYYQGAIVFGHTQDIDTIFNNQDLVFIYEQYTSLQNKVWTTRFSRSLLRNEPMLKRPYRRYSIPLFSSDRKYVIIKSYYNCGNLCGSFGYMLYRKIDLHKWVYVKTFLGVCS